MADLAADWDAVAAKPAAASSAPANLGDEWDAIPARGSARGSAAESSAKSVPDTLVPPTPAREEPQGRLAKLDRAFETYVKGPAEVAATLATGALGGLAGNVAGIVKAAGSFLPGGKGGTAEGANEAAARAQEVARWMTYTPRSEAGQEQLGAVGDVMAASKLQGLGPVEGATIGALSSAGPRAGVRGLPAATVGGVKEVAGAYTPSGIKQAIRPTAATAETASPSLAQGASVGAAGVNIAEQARALAATASPELQAEVAKIGPKITQRGLKALERYVDAETLPVRVPITEGQATGDVAKLSRERNMRATVQGEQERFNQQNKALAENLPAIREKAAPDIYVNTPKELGDIVIQAYKDKDAALRADISAKYQALRDANGGEFPLDGRQFVKNADAALHKEMLFEHTPDKLRAQLSRIGESGNMTFEEFEALRTVLARIQRSKGDDGGNMRAAAGVIRQALEDLPMPPGAEHLKPLADTARSAAAARFRLLEKDRAFKAVVKDTAVADEFIEKYVLGKKADSRSLANMKANLAADEGAQQAIASGAIGKLQHDAMGAGNNFSQAGYNKSLLKLEPKLDHIFNPNTRAELEKLGRVSQYVQELPSGHTVNTSNTFTAAMGEAAKTAAEVTLNQTLGRVLGLGAMPIPLGSMAREAVAKRAATKQAKRTWEPRSGLTIKEIAEGK